MSYPAKNTSTYTAPSKNSASNTLPGQASYQFFLIDDSHFFLLDSIYKLFIDTPTSWSYQTKS